MKPLIPFDILVTVHEVILGPHPSNFSAAMKLTSGYFQIFSVGFKTES